MLFTPHQQFILLISVLLILHAQTISLKVLELFTTQPFLKLPYLYHLSAYSLSKSYQSFLPNPYTHWCISVLVFPPVEHLVYFSVITTS